MPRFHLRASTRRTEFESGSQQQRRGRPLVRLRRGSELGSRFRVRANVAGADEGEERLLTQVASTKRVVANAKSAPRPLASRILAQDFVVIDRHCDGTF